MWYQPPPEPRSPTTGPPGWPAGIGGRVQLFPHAQRRAKRGYGIGGATRIVELHKLNAAATHAAAGIDGIKVGANAVGKVFAQIR